MEEFAQIRLLEESRLERLENMTSVGIQVYIPLEEDNSPPVSPTHTRRARRRKPTKSRKSKSKIKRRQTIASRTHKSINRKLSPTPGNKRNSSKAKASRLRKRSTTKSYLDLPSDDDREDYLPKIPEKQDLAPVVEEQLEKIQELIKERGKLEYKIFE